MSIAFLLVRLILGLAIAAHGAQKLFGWFGGYGLAGTGGFFEQLGFRPGKLFALMAGLAEAGSGLLIVLGLGGAIGPALLVMVMLVAIATVHLPKGFFVTNGGWELNAVYIAGALGLAFGGFGRYSLDRALGAGAVHTTLFGAEAMAVAVVLAGLNLLARRPTGSPSPTP
ncbi:MAG TPA: DoxX family protein [Verrucomicrobiae bacterium]|nr:DoxX family protein [Verrucomicrobiae bacterium]